MSWTPPPSPEEFDERYPEFDPRDYLVDAPRHIPEPDYREALRRTYEARLYEVAAKNEVAPVLPWIRPWYQKAWHAIERGQEQCFAGEILDEILKGEVGAFEWRNLFSVFMLCCLREQRTALATERFEKAAIIAAEVEDALSACRAPILKILERLEEHWVGETERAEIGKLLTEMVSLPRFHELAALNLLAVVADRELPSELKDYLVATCQLAHEDRNHE
ncbi:MAG: hypothetical protein ACYTG0_06660 [Planctomycetota bacterium]|jgi:hypothetical protein